MQLLVLLQPRRLISSSTCIRPSMPDIKMEHADRRLITSQLWTGSANARRIRGHAVYLVILYTLSYLRRRCLAGAERGVRYVSLLVFGVGIASLDSSADSLSRSTTDEVHSPNKSANLECAAQVPEQIYEYDYRIATHVSSQLY